MRYGAVFAPISAGLAADTAMHRGLAERVAEDACLRGNVRRVGDISWWVVDPAEVEGRPLTFLIDGEVVPAGHALRIEFEAEPS